MSLSLEEICQQLSAHNRLRLIDYCIRDAVASAQQVLPLFEASSPEDTSPRSAIEAARTVSEMITQYLAGDGVPWLEITLASEAAGEASEAVSMTTLYTVRQRSVFLAADAACHAANTAMEAAHRRAVEAVRNSACAASSAAVSRWLDESGNTQGQAVEREKNEATYKAKLQELRERAAYLLADQS